jgi:hypothetical protein
LNKDILSRGRSLKLDIQPIWVSRDNPFLLKADAISKGVDTDNWEIAILDFDHLSTLKCPFSVDLFATKDNAKNARFYSRTFEGGSLGVDAFAHSWSGECVFAALAWEFARKDGIGGKEIQFLVLKFGHVRGQKALESLPEKEGVSDSFSTESVKYVMC